MASGGGAGLADPAVRYREVQAVVEIADAIARASALEDVYVSAVQAVRVALGVDRASLLLFDENGVMRFRAWHGLSDAYRQATDGHSPWSRESENPQPLTIHDVAADESLGDLRDIVLEEGIRALAFVPLVAAGRLIGKFMLYYEQPHEFGEAELQLTQALASNIAVEIERRNAERQLRFSRDQLEAVLRSVPDGITVQDATGRLLYANEAAARLVGFSSAEEMLSSKPSEILGRFELLDESGAPFDFERLPGRRVFAGEPTVEAVVRFRVRESGEERWSNVKASAVPDDSGEPRFAVNIFRDVTAERLAEQRERVIAEASTVLGASLEVQETMQQLAVLVVPRLADWCLVHLLRDGEIEPVAIAHSDPEAMRWASELAARYPTRADSESRVAAVLRSGRAQVINDITDDMLVAAAEGEEHLNVLRNAGMSSAMIVPIPAAGQTVGAVTFVSSDSDCRFEAHDLELARRLAERAGLAIDNARAHEAEREARDAAESTGRRLAALESISLVGFSTESSEVLPALLTRARDALQADRATLLLLDEEAGELRIHRAVGIDAEVAAEVRVPVGKGAAGRIAAQDAPLVIDDLNEFPVVGRYLRERGGSLAGVPLHVAGKVAGVLHLSSDQRGRFGQQDTELLSELAERVALVIERTSLWEREHTMAETLQRSFLPERLPTIEGVALAAHYQPAAKGMEIGGDWYDVLRCSDGTVALAVGDVVGKGLHAAAAMGQVRNALRAYAYEGHDPGAILRRLNDLVESIGDPVLTTLWIGKLDPRNRALTYANAGHPPAVLLLAGGDVVMIDDAKSLPLGVQSDLRVKPSVRPLDPRDLLLLFTDGLVERHDLPIGDGLERLRDCLQGRTLACESLLGLVLEHLVGDDPEDDVALLAAQIEDAPSV